MILLGMMRNKNKLDLLWSVVFLFVGCGKLLACLGIKLKLLIVESLLIVILLLLYYSYINHINIYILNINILCNKIIIFIYLFKP